MPPRLTRSFAAALALWAAAPAAAADDPKAVEFFEAKIRPALVEHCLKCHSADAEKAGKLRGGLKLDTKAAWQKGGETGPAVVPGKPAAGTLLASLKYDGELKMPPKGKLPPAVVADFEKWVRDGAVDPRGETVASAKPAGIDLEKGKQFWAFQPPAVHAPPAVRDAGWAKTDIDRFVLAKLEEKGLKPAAPADKRAFVRRAYLDLVGLPPTPEQVEAFAADPSPAAVGKLVDSLLASPHYGERWARHWLDVARFAEDQAHTFGVKPKANAWRYRDWVVKAFNDDMPFDKFARLQIAGDLVPASEGDLATRVAGLGFLGLGAEYYKNTNKELALAEELDDRVDTLTRGFLGLTVSCARCHDHKFDPVPTRDYYSLAGIFAGSALTEAPLAPADEVKKFADAQGKVKEQEAGVAKWSAETARKAASAAVPHTTKYVAASWRVLAARKANGKLDVDALAKKDGLNRYLLDRWTKALDPAASKTPAPLKDLAAAMTFPAKGAPADVPAALLSAAESLQKKLADAVAASPPPSPPPAGKAKPKAAPAKPADTLAEAMFGNPAGPLAVPPEDVEKVIAADADRAALAEMRAELAKRKAATPPQYAVANVLSGGGAGMPVYVRGNPATKGEPAPKGFLQVLPATATPAGPAFTRLDLANAVADRRNPLTARVIVNRVWQQHFGRGLVNTPSNFGALGDRPTHPELLDTLAVRFMDNGWSVKWLHREMMRSAVYQLSSKADAGNDAIDAANVYLWRANRRRLDAEAWRDSVLAVAGTLNPAAGGPAFDLKDAAATRRTIYAKISRHDLNGFLRLFDFPDANVTADRRNSTTVPQQQLFALNSDFMTAQARAFAARLEKAAKPDAERVRLAYKLAYGRDADPREVALAEGFLKAPAAPADKLTRWQQYSQALLAANEIMYVD